MVVFVMFSLLIKVTLILIIVCTSKLAVFTCKDGDFVGFNVASILGFEIVELFVGLPEGSELGSCVGTDVGSCVGS